ncbi:MAG TPA: ankyrin repeat domain-containing protein [Verrucomicrobiae bacterium]|nr:ankyrin repeat domain-containing protein [Verrucomicrobiae bacterium]
MFAASNDLTATLQRGLFEEEANRNLDAAAQAYQAVSTQFDKDRALAATAIFRLGEVYRKQNKTNEAAVQYERIVREFSDQTILVTLSRQNLAGLGAKNENPTAVPLSRTARVEQKRLLEEELKLVEEDLADLKTKFASGLVTQSEVRNREREVLKLRQQVAALDVDEATRVANAVASESNIDAQLLTKLKSLSIKERRDVLPGITNDRVLSELLQQLNTAEIQFASLANNVSENHPDHQRIVSTIKLLNEKIDARVEGIMKAMEIRVSAAQSSDPGAKSDPTITAVLDEEEAEIRRIQAMIQNSPDLINASSGVVTPLGLAAGKGQLRVARFLLDNGADVGRNSPLIQAANGGHKAMVELLLKHGAPVDAIGGNNRTALHRAAERGFLSVTELLLSAKANPNAKDDMDWTPLTLAVANRFTSVAAALLAHGADPNIAGRGPQNNWDRTFAGAPLHLAIAVGNEPMVALLLTNRADLTMLNQLQESPLGIATVLNNTNIARQLIAAGADVNAVGVNGAPPLFAAAQRDHRDIALLLLEHGADPNSTVSDLRAGRTSLMAAVERQNAEIVSSLLRHKADPNFADTAGYTALHYAAGNSDDGAAHIVQMLLSAGAKPDAIDSSGASPLHWAARSGTKDSVELLINAGVELNLRDKSGKTPLDLAKERRLSSLPPAFAGVGAAPSQPPVEHAPSDIIVALRKHGALDELPRLDRIEVRRASANYSGTAFEFGTNKWNQFTLLEVIAWQYKFISTERNATWLNEPTVPSSFWGKSPCPFPDLSHIMIRRSTPGKPQWTETAVNVAAVLDSGDCVRDVILQPGDIVEIPEMDHPVNEKWRGLTDAQVSNLLYCVSRRIEVSVKGIANPIRLSPQWTAANRYGPSGERMKELTKGSFMLKSVLAQSRLVRASSDMSRVKVTRRANGKTQEWVMDCSSGHDPDFWLRDGDVIEVPDKS